MALQVAVPLTKQKRDVSHKDNTISNVYGL